MRLINAKLCKSQFFVVYGYLCFKLLKHVPFVTIHVPDFFDFQSKFGLFVLQFSESSFLIYYRRIAFSDFSESRLSKHPKDKKEHASYDCANRDDGSELRIYLYAADFDHGITLNYDFRRGSLYEYFVECITLNCKKDVL